MVDKVIDTYFQGLSGMLTALTTAHPIYFATLGVAWIMMLVAVVIYTAPLWGAAVALYQGIIGIIVAIKK